MKKNDWKDRLNVVYSTNPDFGYEMDNDEEQVTLDKDKQNLRVSIDKKNRGGKVVTLITGFVGTEDDLKELGYGEIGELCMTGPAMMLHYAGWKGEELTERALINHADGKCWLHTGDKAYINEHGIVYVLGRGSAKRFGGGELYMMRMETKAVRVDGVEDGFFCFVPDQVHDGYFLPYFFVILDGTKTLDEVKAGLADALEDHHSEHDELLYDLHLPHAHERLQALRPEPRADGGAAVPAAAGRQRYKDDGNARSEHLQRLLLRRRQQPRRRPGEGRGVLHPCGRDRPSAAPGHP